MIFHVQISNVNTVFCPDSERHLKQEKGAINCQENIRAAGSATTATNNINKHKVIKQDT